MLVDQRKEFQHIRFSKFFIDIIACYMNLFTYLPTCFLTQDITEN